MIRRILRVLIPYSIRKRRYYHHDLHSGENDKLKESKIAEIKNKKRATVLFVPGVLAMWRYQGVVEKLLADNRFRVVILIAPFRRYTTEEKLQHVCELRSYFASKGINSIQATTDFGFNLEKWFESINPDIIFYCQQYNNFYDNVLNYENNYGRLWGFIPYGLQNIKQQFVYNSEFQNLAWRYYQATTLHLKTMRRIMANDAVNVRIVGEPHADEYLGPRGKDPWKVINDGKRRKRIIWAPHFSIHDNWLLYRASFLWLYEGMVELARKYADTVQFTFKPHPHLYDTLCKHKDWGKERTDKYYRLWAEMLNTQIETGEFIELFMYSDGMIHDCGSFTGEYMFTRKPVMFMSRDFKSIYDQADDFGHRCLDLHDVGRTLADAERFINDVILSGNDPKAEKRQKFFDENLIPPNGKSVAENIYEDMVTSLGLH